MAGQPKKSNRAELEARGEWEDFVAERQRRRRAELEELWEAELDAVLRESGEELSDGVRRYLVGRLAESNRRPSRAQARAGMSEERDRG